MKPSITRTVLLASSALAMAIGGQAAAETHAGSMPADLDERMARFIKMDGDNSGTLSRIEYVAYARSEYGMDTGDADAAFADAAGDDGRLAPSEFLKMAALKAPEAETDGMSGTDTDEVAMDADADMPAAGDATDAMDNAAAEMTDVAADEGERMVETAGADAAPSPAMPAPAMPAAGEPDENDGEAADADAGTSAMTGADDGEDDGDDGAWMSGDDDADDAMTEEAGADEDTAEVDSAEASDESAMASPQGASQAEMSGDDAAMTGADTDEAETADAEMADTEMSDADASGSGMEEDAEADASMDDGSGEDEAAMGEDTGGEATEAAAMDDRARAEKLYLNNASFAEVDADDNGSISRDEYIAFVADASISEAEAGAVFDVVSKNDGSLSRLEYYNRRQSVTEAARRAADADMEAEPAMSDDGEGEDAGESADGAE